MRKVLKLIGFASVTLVLFFIVASVAFYHLVRVGEFRRFLIDEIEKNTALKVELGEADLEIGWITGIVFRQVAIAEPDAAQPAITAESVTARVALTPLLQRKVVFYEIRLQKPVAQFVGDQHGRIPLLDKLLNLPFLKQPDHEFQLDLRAVKVLNAAIEFTDPRPDSGIGTWRLLNADVYIERVRGQRLRDFVKDLLQRGTPESAAALEFSFRGAVEKDHDKMNVKADGRLLFPKEVLEFHEARWIADLEVVELPAALIKEYAARRVPIKSMTGHFAQRLHLDGNPSRQMRFKGELDFRQLAIDAPEFFLAPLAGADGRTSFELDWTRQRLQLTRVDFRTNDIKFSLQGEVRALDGDNPHLNLTVSALSTPLPALRKYLPVKVAQMPRLERALDGIQGGQVEIKKAGVNASVGELRRLAETGVGKQLWFDAEIRDAAGKLPVDNTLPLRAVQGRIKLENGLLTFDNIRGNYGDSRLTDVDGSYDLVPAGGGKLDLHAVGDFNLAELREQLKSAMSPAQAAKIASSVQELGGRGKADLTIKSAPDTPIQFGGKAVLDNARVRYGDYSLSEIRGELQFSPKEIKGEKIRAQLRGSPVQIQLALSDYTSDDGAFDLTVEFTGMRAGVITSLLLDTGSLQDPGIVRGWVRYRGPFLNKEARRLTGNLDLINVQLALQPLLQPLRELNGKIQIDETGIDFQNLRALLVGFPANASGRWRFAGKPQLLFDFAAPNLDVSYLISQVDPEASEFYATLQALGKIALGRGRLRNFEFTDLKTDAAIDRRVWRLTNLTARAGGGAITGVTTVVDKPDTLGIVTEPKIQAVPIEVFLKWFNITNTEMTGKVVLGGKLETVGKDDADRKQNLNGAFHLRIEDGTINRMRLLVQLLNLLDLSRWFTLQLPDLTKEGIRFRAITGDFKVVKGVYSTENLVVDSNDLRMTGAGKIDVPKDELDFVVAVRPFAGIDTVLNYIPLLGRGVAAIKNSFLVASFNIKGSIDNPTITPAPLGTLTEWFWGVLGIPKSIIGLGEGESTKEEPKEPSKAPAK